MRCIWLNSLTYILSCFLLLTSFFAEALDSQAPYAVLIDAKNATVLFEKQAHKAVPPSSMSKLMSLYVIFNKLKDGSIKEDGLVPVSAAAYNAPGTRMFLEIGQQVQVRDLLLGMIVQSGNDATIALAEFIAGTEANFVQMMNQEAQKLGLLQSHFGNSSGLPHPQQYMSCYDLAILSKAIIDEHPEYYKLFNLKEFTYSGITQYSRNTALGQMGVDGLKTGFTDAGGYGIAMSAQIDDNRRLIAVVNGLPSEQARIDAARDLITHGINDFHTIKIAAAKKAITTAPIWHGELAEVAVVAKNDIEVMLPKQFSLQQIDVKVVMTTPLHAPLSGNDKVAVMRVKLPNETTLEVELYPQCDVGEAGMLKKVYQNIMSKIWVN
jgi:D-alanyl-D-alanine carboxypeptidase (penicillin-binding protein 5/6)